MKRLICLLSIVAYTAAMNAQSFRINEIMQSNINCVYADYDFPDSWIELKNISNSTLDIKGLYVSPTADIADGYCIAKSVKVDAGGFTLIYLDKENTGRHASFRLESDEAGTIYLFDANGNQIDAVDYPAMPAPNIAYAHRADGSWAYEVKPTPLATNQGPFSSDLLPSPDFSQKGHLMTSPEQVTISIPSSESLPEDTKLCVTTDGSEPTSSDACTGNEVTIDINESMVIHARLISKNALCPMSKAESFIMHPRAVTMPVVSISTDDKYLYSKEMGMLSSEIADGFTNENFRHDWRRPVSIEYFESENKPAAFSQWGETAVSGNYSRRYNQKSLKLYANKRFGTKNFKKALWTAKPDVKKTKTFVMRNGGQADSNRARIKDALAQIVFGRNIDELDYQEYQPAIMYINGQFSGLYGLRERSDENYVESNYGLDEDEIEITDEEAYTQGDDYVTNHYPLFKQFRDMYRSNATTFEQLEQVMDIDNFIAALQGAVYIGNTDWPHKNVSMWRPLSSDGKWRWIMKDMDIFGSYSSDYNMLRYLLGAEEGDMEYEQASREKTLIAAQLYCKMFSLPEFKERFINSYAARLGDFLKPELMVHEIDSIENMIHDELMATFTLIGYGTQYHNNAINRLRQYCNERNMAEYKHMTEMFNLGYVIPMTTANETGSTISVNGIELRHGNFNGACWSDYNVRVSSDNENLFTKMKITYANGDEKVVTFAKNDVTVNAGKYIRTYIPGDSIVSVSFIIYEDNEIEPSSDILVLTDTNHDIPLGYYAEGNISYSRKMTEGKYYPFCLPFDVNLSSNSNKVSKVYLSADMALLKPSGNIMVLFKETSADELIHAGQPFVVKSNTDGYLILKNATAMNVDETIDNQTVTDIDVYNYDTTHSILDSNNSVNVQLITTFEPVYNLDKSSCLAFTSTGAISGATAVNSFRFFFSIGSVSEARSISASFGEDAMTAVTDIEKTKSSSDYMFDVYGRKVLSKTIVKGLYIINGKKVLVK